MGPKTGTMEQFWDCGGGGGGGGHISDPILWGHKTLFLTSPGPTPPCSTVPVRRMSSNSIWQGCCTWSQLAFQFIEIHAYIFYTKYTLYKIFGLSCNKWKSIIEKSNRSINNIGCQLIDLYQLILAIDDQSTITYMRSEILRLSLNTHFVILWLASSLTSHKIFVSDLHCTVHFLIDFYYDNTPVWNYTSVPTNNNLKLRLVLNCAIHLLYFLEQLSTSLNFKLLFVGTEA